MEEEGAGAHSDAYMYYEHQSEARRQCERLPESGKAEKSLAHSHRSLSAAGLC